jgi:hypothetical protein|tara:strand:- start:229 stop:435 length:207 start_codon:yes stop_codon:yes gene_type:complete
MEIGVKVMATKKEKIFGKEEEDKLKESYKQSLKNKKEREDYFERKSVKQLLEEMDQEELKKIDERNGF